MSRNKSRLIEALDHADFDNNWCSNVQLARHSSNSDHTPVKSRPETFQKSLKGNTTGLLMRTATPRPISPEIKNSRSVIVKSNSSPPRTRRLLSLPKKKVSLDCEALNRTGTVSLLPNLKRCSTKSEQSPTVDHDVDPSANLLAICNNCGITTTNFEMCDRCKIKLPKNPKTYNPDKQETTQKKSTSTFSASSSAGQRRTFYKNHLAEASYVCPIRRRKIPLTFQKVNSKRARNTSSEPMVLTLSSDEELQEVEPKVESRANGSNIEKKDSNDASEDPCTDSVTDSEGSALSLNDKEPKSDGDYVANVKDLLSTPAMEKGGIAIQCRSVRIGSYKVLDKMLRYPIGFTFNQITMRIPPVGEENKLITIEIRSIDIVKAVSHFGSNLLVMFIQVSPAFASFTRTRLDMLKHEGPYYDAESEDDKIKWLILLPTKMEANQRSFVSMMFNELGDDMNTKKRIHHSVDYKTANQLLLGSSPTAVVDKLKSLISKKPTKNSWDQISKHSFSRVPVIRQSPRTRKECDDTEMVVSIATYPPPPQVGGITVTSDDMKRLNPGEFINDVLIDFYLKYLFYAKLSEEDRKRTHIFSSFFYRGLNKVGADESASATEGPRTKDELAQRRHSRVRTWTRHVDLFAKDFIIIPVNENAHWFLAVICFPNLAGVVGDEESCPPPSADHDYESESVSESNFSEMNSSQGESSTDTESITKNEDIFSEILSRSSSSSLDVQKWPCILIFDSFSSRSCWNYVINMLRDYLSVEFQEKKNFKRVFSKETIRGSYPKAPQQTNSYDCGLYVLQYAECFFEKPIKNFKPPIQEPQKWFNSEHVAKTKRKEIGDLIRRLQSKQTEAANNCQKATATSEEDPDKSSSSPAKS